MSGDWSCEAVGLDAFRQQALAVVPRIQDVGGAALVREMAGVLAISRALCPVDTGRLAASGRVDGPFRSGDVVDVFISYGGDIPSPYPLIQHERLDLKHAPGKQAKFLERPLLEWTRGASERLAREIGAGLRAGASAAGVPV